MRDRGQIFDTPVQPRHKGITQFSMLCLIRNSDYLHNIYIHVYILICVYVLFYDEIDKLSWDCFLFTFYANHRYWSMNEYHSFPVTFQVCSITDIYDELNFNVNANFTSWVNIYTLQRWQVITKPTKRPTLAWISSLLGSEVIKLFSYSAQSSMKFFLLINIKMPTNEIFPAYKY